jgi:hypothetical protein
MRLFVMPLKVTPGLATLDQRSGLVGSSVAQQPGRGVNGDPGEEGGQVGEVVVDRRRRHTGSGPVAADVAFGGQVVNLRRSWPGRSGPVAGGAGSGLATAPIYFTEGLFPEDNRSSPSSAGNPHRREPGRAPLCTWRRRGRAAQDRWAGAPLNWAT